MLVGSMLLYFPLFVTRVCVIHVLGTLLERLPVFCPFLLFSSVCLGWGTRGEAPPFPLCEYVEISSEVEADRFLWSTRSGSHVGTQSPSHSIRSSHSPSGFLRCVKMRLISQVRPVLRFSLKWCGLAPGVPVSSGEGCGAAIVI